MPVSRLKISKLRNTATQICRNSATLATQYRLRHLAGTRRWNSTRVHFAEGNRYSAIATILSAVAIGFG